MRLALRTALILASFFHADYLFGAELVILPAEIKLDGPNTSQRLIALSRESGKVVGQAQVKYSSSNPAVAAVDAAGTVRAIGDGEAIISAIAGSDKTTAKVRVAGTKAEAIPSFRNHVIPVLTRLGCNSGACHGALAGKGGFKLSLRGYAPEDDYFVLTRQALTRRVNPVEPSLSLMLRKPTLTMPHGGGLKLEVDSPEFKLLANWIASGAPGPRDNDAKLQRLEVFPAEAILSPKKQLPIVARAWYSDGRSEDVTRWARFGSTEDLVATVNDAGHVMVGGHGEASITVGFGSQVALCRIASPLPNKIDPKVFADAPRANFIDDLVLKKLEALRIPPSPACDDYTFIRRAYLDAAGILPTPEEVEKFVANPAKDKRAKLIETLLARSECVDYWAYKWSDLLLISTRKLSQPATWAFYQHVRQSVADNKPWDRFAREILTAKGSNLQNGAANYFILHKDVSDLTEATAVTFLGMSVTCCRCHNHPMEKWTQDQYWSLANLFARVGVKNGERPGEFSVLSLPDGDVPHLRRGFPMPPTPLDGKPFTGTGDRRQYFADWLTAPDNPYFARAIVNRVWRNFMGRGLVEAVDDLRQTNPASNEELLDALAKDFVKHKYDMKHLMRQIMNSAAYQRSATPVKGNASDDRFYSRYLVRRLSAEVLLDAYSQVTSVPANFNQVQVGSSGGFAATNAYPLGTRALQLPDALVVSQFLDAFGRPERGQTCSCERQEDATVTQALHLNNGKTLNDKLRDKKSRIEGWVKDKISDEEAIRRVFLLSLSRTPTAQERQRLLALLGEAANRREALEDLYWAVLTGREFLFNR